MKTKLIVLILFSLMFVQLLISYNFKTISTTNVTASSLESSTQIIWNQTNGPPGGGYIKQLIQNPYHHNELYALLDGTSPNTGSNRVYKSSDKGEYWAPISEPTNNVYSSIAAYEAGVFLAGPSGLKYFNGTQITNILPQSVSTVTISDNKIFVAIDSPTAPTLLYSDLSLGFLTWKDISPAQTVLNCLSPPPANSGIPHGISVSNIVAFGNKILANIVLNAVGSGEYTNGQLFVTEDLGKTWSQVKVGTPLNIIITEIFQEQNNSQHLILTYAHTVTQQIYSPLSDLVKESNDGGKTWRPLTNLTLSSSGVACIEMVGSTYFLLNSYDSLGIIKLNDSGYQRIQMPQLPGINSFPTISTLLFDLDDPNIVYGSSSYWAYGMFKSVDGMQTWKKMGNGIVASSPTIVLPHPTNSSIILTSGNVIQEKYLTQDEGITWQPYSPTTAGDEIRFDPYNPNHIILIDESSAIYESYDLGRTFTQINNNFYGSKIYDFQLSPDDPGKIYVANVGLGISQYDASTGWQYMSGSPDYSYAFQIDPQDSNVLYASYSPKTFENYSSIWKYTPNQTSNFGWTEIARFENSSGITSLQFDPSNPNNMYVGVIGQTGTVYKSNDHGNTWQKLNNDLTFTTIWGHSQLQIDPRDKNTAYAGTWGGGTYKTTNAGKDWTLLDTNQTFSPTWITISDSNPNVVYACDRLEAKIHRSNDSGQTWYTYYDFGKNYLLTGAVAIDPTDSDAIYASAFSPPMAHEGSFIKIKNGQKIADMTSQLPRSVIDVQIDKRTPSTLYVTTHVYGVYKSTDGGTTWKRLDDNGKGLPRTGFYDVEIDPNDSNKLYATALSGELPWYMAPPNFQNLEGNCGVYESKDGGEHWTQILQTVSEARGIAIDPRNTQNLYVADMAGGIWVSSNGGLNWRQENRGLGSTSMTSVKIKDDQIYASTQGSGVYSGTIQPDGSISWDSAKSNKPKAYVSNIQIRIDPTNSNRIYAAGYPGGLLRSDDGGLHWNDKNFLTPSIKVDDPTRQGYYAFDIDPTNTSNIWLGAYGKGLFISHDFMDYDMPANGDNNVMSNKHVKAIRINPSNPNEVYVGTEEGVFVTHDGGHNWSQINDGLQTQDIRSLKLQTIHWAPFWDDFENANTDGWSLASGWNLATDGSNHVLEGTLHSFASVGSPNWKDYTFQSKVKLLNTQNIHVNFRMNSDHRYFLGFGSNGLYLSKQFNQWSQFDNNLATSTMTHAVGQWHDLKIQVSGANIQIFVDNTLEINYTDPTPLSNGYIAFESFDNSHVYIDNINVTSLKDETEVYVGTGGYGLYRFDQTTSKWQNLGRTLGMGWWTPWERRMYQFSSLVFDPVTPGKVYLGHFPGGFFISEDNGHTWKDSSIGLGNDGIFTLTMNPNNSSILWAGTYNGVAESVNGGKTWQLKNNGMPSEQWPFTVAIDGSNTNIMYASTKNGQNKGLSYRNQFLGVVMKSTDGGQNWFKIMNGLSDQNEYYKLLIYPLNHNVLFLSSSNGVFLSEDAGATWKPINNGLPTTNNQVRDNVADNLALTCDNKTLLLGLMSYGMWKADLSQIDTLLPSSSPSPMSTPSSSPSNTPPSATPTPTALPSPTTSPSPTQAPATTPIPTETSQTPTPIPNPTPSPNPTVTATSPTNSPTPSVSPEIPEVTPIYALVALTLLTVAAGLYKQKTKRTSRN